ncbi:MAG TPA: phosphohistidine phosphatase SixA [Pirellulales bacterium]|nr:phosphohistidine phosphatase SixA [Pirellulales bacterium]
MLLYIVRHAWAEVRDVERFPDDDLRPLTGDGKKRFGRMMARLTVGGFRPTRIATSPLIRCRQTAELIVNHLSDPAQLVELDELRPGAELKQLIDWSAGQTDEAIAWVGHAPDVSELTAALVGDCTATIRFAKGAVAAIEFDREIAQGKGELNWLVTAKILGV